MVKNKPLISVVVPVYNEIENIKDFHRQLLETLRNYKKSFEIIYIDDNSLDGTFEWLTSVSMQNAVKVLRKEGKKGKAYSLIQGFNEAKGDVLAMIDGDLQYPPQKIPEMVDALAEADVVVANRKKYHDIPLRKLLSRGFRKIFGEMMFGLSTDIQSGLKVFTRELYQMIKFTPSTPWTFDLEFLSRARQAGFVLKNVPITFAPRLHGESKINIFKQTFEIGTNALQLKTKNSPHFPIEPENGSMRGAGIGYKRKKYITHTTLPIKLSAIQTFSLAQKIFFIGAPIAIVLALIAFPLNTARWITGGLSILYFIDALFNVFVVSKSLNKDQEIHITDEDINALDESTLPVYTILCPLYKEAHVASQFLEAIAQLDWPKEKLDVMFLLEEKDPETIEAFDQMLLPYYARTVIVPDSQPKTKPKACNYGLSFARGEYLVIFDAEDVPEPSQLKKAYLGFQKAPKNVTCLQAKLSYYNSHQNLLTRFFTAEYALWFDVTLPGLQSLNSALPLGGTSNHFQTQKLLELQGWDPFNVTEDADLGVRLFQKGYRTAIINSNTFEEATSVNKNWLRQRSRWLKGYMQTYLVHMRNITSFVKEKGIVHNLIFQLTIGGKILFVLLNPFMWIITFLYFAAYPIFGPTIQAIYQPPISYLAVFSWIFGNFMFMYCYMIAAAKRQQWDLTKYVPLIPLYWLMMSTAAMIAAYQLILKPHYWEKTLHGFHLGRKEKEEKTTVKQPVYQPGFRPAYAYLSDASQVQKPQRDVIFALSKIKKPSISIPSYRLPKMTLPKVAKPEVKQRPSWMNLSLILGALPILTVFNLDLLLAYMYLPPAQAQIYLMMSLFAKAVYLINQFSSNTIASLWSMNKVTKNHFNKLVFLTFMFNWIAFIVFGLQGNYTIPALFGEAFKPVISSFGFYIFGLMCFALASRYNKYYLNKKDYTFTLVSLLTMLLQVPLISMHHGTFSDIVRTFAYLGSVNLILVLFIHYITPFIHILNNNVHSLIGLFEQSASKKVWNENNMRILIFNWRDTKHVYAGGAEVYIEELAKRWTKNGNHVTLFCGNDNKNLRYEQTKGLEIYRRGGTYTVYLFAVIYYLTKFRGKYDVIIDCENGIPFFMPLIAKEQVILLIHHVHQEIFRKFLKFPVSSVAEILEGKLMPFIYQNKTVVTVSSSSRQDIFELGFTNAKNVEIIPNGVSDSLFVTYPKTEQPSFIYLGRLKEYKNIDIAIQAFSKVVKVCKNATLDIVGMGESYPVLKKLVHDLKLEDAVTFHGRVNEREKAMLLGQSWVALQPSQMEGWGITVIEANAAGTPVIASEVSGLQDSVIHAQTGLLVPVGDVAAWAVAMRNLVEDDAQRMSLSQEAQLWARNFDWNKSAEGFYSLIGKNFGHGLNPIFSRVLFSSAEKSINNV